MSISVAFTNIIHYLHKIIGVLLVSYPLCARFNEPTELVYPKQRPKSIQTGVFPVTMRGFCFWQGAGGYCQKRVYSMEYNKFPYNAQQAAERQKAWWRTDFQHRSTFVKMILGNLAKADRMQFKKLSYFRLVFYKLYAGNQKRSNPKVENLVESVEFHRQNRL